VEQGLGLLGRQGAADVAAVGALVEWLDALERVEGRAAGLHQPDPELLERLVVAVHGAGRDTRGADGREELAGTGQVEVLEPSRFAMGHVGVQALAAVLHVPLDATPAADRGLEVVQVLGERLLGGRGERVHDAGAA